MTSTMETAALAYALKRHCSWIQSLEFPGPSCACSCDLAAQVLYNSSQPHDEPAATSEWAAAWLQQLSSRRPASAAPSALVKLGAETRAEHVAAAQSHPAVTEVLSGLAVIPGMQLVMQSTQGAAYKKIVAQADLGLCLGAEQVLLYPSSGNAFLAGQACSCHPTPNSKLMRYECFLGLKAFSNHVASKRYHQRRTRLILADAGAAAVQAFVGGC